MNLVLHRAWKSSIGNGTTLPAKLRIYRDLLYGVVPPQWLNCDMQMVFVVRLIRSNKVLELRTIGELGEGELRVGGPKGARLRRRLCIYLIRRADEGIVSQALQLPLQYTRGPAFATHVFPTESHSPSLGYTQRSL